MKKMTQREQLLQGYKEVLRDKGIIASEVAGVRAVGVEDGKVIA